MTPPKTISELERLRDENARLQVPCILPKISRQN